MRMWKKSKLSIGERVRIQERMLQTPGERFIKAEVDGETDYGIRLRLYFEPGSLSEDTKWDYMTFVSWPSIYCGDVKIATYDGKEIKAERLIHEYIR